ncbi:MAG: acyltransferase [Solobacterium sp.]|nr:acyltransferase [Solobacterium sp.]
MKREKLTFLDGLKGFAIPFVAIVHSGIGQLPEIGKYTGDIARMVQMLFMISALLTFRSLARTFPDRSKMTKEGILWWYKKKLLRLLPQYYLALILTMLTRSWNTFWLGTEGHVTIWNILAHVFLVHGFFPHYIDSMLGVEWYLGVLVIFDFLSPFLYKYLDSLESSILFLTGVFIVKPFFIIALRHILPVASDPAVYNNFIDTFSPYAQFMVFIIGIIMYYMLEKIEQTEFKHPRLLGAALQVLAFGLIFCQFIRQSRLLPMTRHDMFALFFLPMFAGMYLRPLKFIDNPYFRLWGKYSYTIFLYNYIVMNFYERTVQFEAPFVVKWLVESIVVNIILLLLAMFLERYFDKPISEKLGPKLLGAKP